MPRASVPGAFFWDPLQIYICSWRFLFVQIKYYALLLLEGDTLKNFVLSLCLKI